MIAQADNIEMAGARAGAFVAAATLIRARSIKESERSDFIERSRSRIAGAIELGCQIMRRDGCNLDDVDRYRSAAISAAMLRFNFDQVRGWQIK
jgi:hypothetical protein